MNRRRFLQGIIAGLLTAPLAAEAQTTGKIPRIGDLLPSATQATNDAFWEELRNLGYVEGQKTAKAPGLTIPQSLFLRADQVIE